MNNFQKSIDQVLVLEPSTNTHAISNVDEYMSFDNGTVLMRLKEGSKMVSHGEHGTLATESRFCVKLVQQELNPLTQQMQNAFD